MGEYNSNYYQNWELTGQPAESRKLLVFMKNLQPSRLCVLVGTPNFLKNLDRETLNFFQVSGSSYVKEANGNDHWMMIWKTVAASSVPESHLGGNDRREPFVAYSKRTSEDAPMVLHPYDVDPGSERLSSEPYLPRLKVRAPHPNRKRSENFDKTKSLKLQPEKGASTILPSKKLLTKTEDYVKLLEKLHHRFETIPTKSKILVETLLTSGGELPKRGSAVVSLFVDLSSDDTPCHWYEDPLLKQQAEFCLKYEGYGELCACNNPYTVFNKSKPEPIVMKENIPVAIITANKPHHLYRLFRNLDLVHGSAQTTFLLVIDGYQEETINLSRLFGYDFRLHVPQGFAGENTRANMNIGFGLWAVFNHFPEADKAVILEDDLVLSPDLLSYFHQTSHLLDKDETLSHINAFGQNSYPLTAANLSTVLRVEMYPQYGWLTTRRWFKKVTSFWVHEGKGVDWDWWLFSESRRQEMQSLVPEVSRTGHAGSAGEHVSGYRQFYYFDTRIMSNAFETIPISIIERLTPRERYHKWMLHEITRSKKLKLTDSPCNYEIVPRNETGPFVLYIGAPSKNDDKDSFYLLQTCLGTDETDLKELYDGVMRLNLLTVSKYLTHGTNREILYIVGCPLSSFCKYSEEIVDWIYPPKTMLEGIGNLGFFRKYIRL